MYLNGLNGVDGLGALPDGLGALIMENADTITKVLDRATTLNGLGRANPPKTLSFDQVLSKYNPGITTGDIEAWVFYKRTYDKIPMHGWEKYHGADPIDLLKKGFLYYKGGKYLPEPIYTMGNMYDHVQQLDKDKAYIVKTYGETVYNKHQEAINSSTPRKLTITNVDKKERPKILLVSKLASSFEVKDLRDETGITLNKKTSLTDVFDKWLQEQDKEIFTKSSAYDIIYVYLHGKRITTRRGLSKQQKQDAKSEAREMGEALFERFLHEALVFEDQERLDMLWNRLYNGVASVQYHKVPIAFNLSAKFKGFDLEIRPAQREGVAYQDIIGSGINAYDVGVGKTMTAIIEIANALQSGKAERPLICVPNPTYKKWIEELVGKMDKDGNVISEGILSHTGVKINDWYNLGTGIHEKIDFEKMVPEKSITIVTYEGFRKIGFGDKVADDLFIELCNILSQNDNKKRRDEEVDYEKYREKIGVGLKNTIADIDTLGFDYIVIDEAHRCKNVFDSVKVDNEQAAQRYQMRSAVSETGVKAFFLCNYIQKTFNRNVMLLTATPFTNSPLEIYSMLSLVAHDSLQDMNIFNIQDFFETFVLPTNEYSVTVTGEIKSKEVVKAFNNRLILQKLIHRHINYKTGEEAGINRPCKINLPRVNTVTNGKIKRLSTDKQILTYLDPTDDQKMNQAEIVAQLEKSTAGKLDSAMLLRALSHSLNNALSPYIYEQQEPESAKAFVDGSPKIKYTCECIRSVKEYHESKGQDVSGQVIYMNRGKDYFPYIKEYLETNIGYKREQKYVSSNGRSIKVDEVEIITSSISNNRKEAIKEAFLAGVCKVIIGTATIREGIDLQNNGTVIYNCYPDWNPTDIHQIEGRIWRQGNRFGYVRVAMPLIKDSMDIFVFQKLEEKTMRINDIWYRGDRGNVLDVESLDPEEIKFALITDLTQLAKIEVDKDHVIAKKKLESSATKIDTLSTIKSLVHDYNYYRERLLAHVTKWKESYAAFDYMNQTKAELNTRFREKNQYAFKDLAEKEIKSKFKKYYDAVQRDKDMYKELCVFAAQIPQEDKELLKISRKLAARQQYFDNIGLTYFKENLAKVKKNEKTLLEPLGLTIDSDFAPAIEHYKKEHATLEDRVSEILTDEYFEKIMLEIEKKKKELAIKGGSIKDRVKEFSQLNWVLDYKDQGYPNACDMSVKPKHVPPKPKRNLKMMKLKAKALKLKLELLKL